MTMFGLNLFGGLIAYGGTFLVFSDYMKPAIRIAALSRLPSIFVFTHDSVGLGEDGPTHQPFEHLMALRAVPYLTVIRPADANEVAQAWKYAISHRGGPVALPSPDRPSLRWKALKAVCWKRAPMCSRISASPRSS